eukprot:gene42046-52120_t
MNYYDFHHGSVLNRGFVHAEDSAHLFVSQTSSSGGKKWSEDRDEEGDIEFSGGGGASSGATSSGTPVLRIGRVSSSGSKMNEESELQQSGASPATRNTANKWNKKQYFQVQSAEDDDVGI